MKNFSKQKIILAGSMLGLFLAGAGVAAAHVISYNGTNCSVTFSSGNTYTGGRTITLAGGGLGCAFDLAGGGVLILNKPVIGGTDPVVNYFAKSFPAFGKANSAVQ